MRRRQFLAVLSFALAAGAASASEAPKKEAVGQYIDVAPVALPVVVDGVLINYVFTAVRINLVPSADVTRLRDKEPWIRDALVRASHRTPFTVPTSYIRIDEARLKTTLAREAGAIIGARNIASIVVVSQTPKQRTRLPTPPGAPR